MDPATVATQVATAIPGTPTAVAGALPGSGAAALTFGAPAVGGTGGNRWLYDLLTRSGLSPSTARDVNQLVVHPLEVLIVILGAILAAHFGAKVLRRVLRRLAHPAADRFGSPRATARIDTVVALVANVWRFVVVVVAISILLAMLGIDLTPLLASAAVVGATIGFGAQTLVRDYLSGVLLTVEDQYGIGDSVTVTNPSGTDTIGVVEDLSLRITRLRDADGVVWFIPNGDIRRLGNTSRSWVRVTVDVPVAASSPDDLDRARGVLLEAAQGVTQSPTFATASPEPPRFLGIVNATERSCTLRLAARTTADLRASLEGALLEACVRALMEAGMWTSSTA